MAAASSAVLEFMGSNGRRWNKPIGCLLAGRMAFVLLSFPLLSSLDAPFSVAGKWLLWTTKDRVLISLSIVEPTRNGHSLSESRRSDLKFKTEQIFIATEYVVPTKLVSRQHNR
jgi:hypothetical protein